ncbi:MAG TPA: alpha/beta hydrolase [Conexibacter sp.]|nr:alpha/beta hydrolase [Conexibacter sp.]
MRRKRIVVGVVLAVAAAVVVLNWTWGRLPAQPPMTGRLVHLREATVRVLERPGRDPAVVLMHGQPGTADDFDDVTARLPGVHTIAFDRPGYGFSSGGFHSFADQLTTVDELLAALHLRRVVLVGHSYGGSLALAYAERRPQAVRGLVLLDAAAAGDRTSGFDRAQAHLIQVLQWPVVRQLSDATFSQLFRTAAAKQGDAQAFDPGEVAPAHEHRLLALNMKTGDIGAFAGEALETNDALARVDRGLASIAAPAIVVQGAGDKLVEPRYGRKLAATLPHARLVIVGGGHMAPYVHPALVAAEVRRLLK